MQDDLAVVSTEGDRHWLSAIHLCFPNSWAAEDKIGRTFAAVHAPVAGMDAMNRRGDELVRLMVGATAGLVRFAWGITFDDRLNHHPDPPGVEAPPAGFDPTRPRAFLRVERQTIWGFPDVAAALFTIRTYLYGCGDIRRDPVRREYLAAAIASMSPESLAYKGLAGAKDALIRWLSSESRAELFSG